MTLRTHDHPAEPSWHGLSALVDGELADAEGALRELDRPGALDALRDLVRTRALFTTDRASETLSSSGSAALWRQIRAEQRRHWGRRIWLVAALLAMVLGVGIFLGLLLPDPGSAPPPASVAAISDLYDPPPADRVLRLGPDDRSVPPTHLESLR